MHTENGLFGTCGTSTFRADKFIPRYAQLGFKENVDYYNPQVDDWSPELVKVEAEHLATDQIILFPVTHETYATGSLAEVGFSILSAIKLDDRRSIVVMIDDYLDEHLMQDKERAKDSLRARALVKTHLQKLNLSNIYMVNTLDEMLELSVDLWFIHNQLEKLSKFSIGK